MLTKEVVIDRLKFLVRIVDVDWELPGGWCEETASAALELIKSTDSVAAEKLRAENLRLEAELKTVSEDRYQIQRELSAFKGEKPSGWVAVDEGGLVGIYRDRPKMDSLGEFVPENPVYETIGIDAGEMNFSQKTLYALYKDR